MIGYNGIADIVSIPDNVYVIADHTFENRLSVEKLIFGADSQLTTVCQYAFSGCANIAEIVFPANMQFIDDYAFADCPHLFAVVFLSDVEVRGSAFTGSGNVYSTGVTRTFGPSSVSYSYIFTGVSSGTGYYILKAPDGAGEQGAFEGWFTDETLSSGATFPLILTEDVVFHAGYDEVNPSTNGLVFSLSSDGYEVTGYTGTNKYVTVPSTYLGKKVVGIAENAFLDLDIVYFSLPDTIKRIGRNAFSGTTWLTLITDNTAVIGSYLIKYNGQQAEFRLPDGIRYIADGAFENNDSIRAFYTGNRLTVVPAYCFRNCINLRTVVLGKETAEIGAYAFADCASLQSVDFSAATHLNKVHYTAFDNSYWRTYYPDDSIVINKIYYAYIGSNDTLHVPNSVTLVNPYAFYGNNSIRYVYIPESVVTIGECAFAESSLEKIFFADSFSNLTTIERRAFYRCHSVVDFNFRFCNNLTSIGEEAFCGIKRKSSDILLTFYIPELTDTLGERVFAESDVYTVYFSEDNRLLELPRQAFYNCKLLVSVRFFGESFLQSIADEAFCGCTSLSTFTDDRAFLSEIGERAFYGCSSLSMLGINETTLVTVGNNAFAGTSYVGTSDVMVFLGSVLMKYNGIQSTVYIPAETTEIANEAFIGNTRIASIEFTGEELVAIRYRAFMDCSSVTKIVLPSSIESIEEGAFAGCSSLTSFTIRTTGSDSGYISVSGVLFRYYTKNDRRYAELIAYPNKHAGIYEIPDSIVCDGKPFTVTSIAAYAFYNCVDLRQLTLPSGLVTIGNNAFYGCSSLQTLTLPATLKTIGAHAFASCSVMTSVSYAGTETDWNAIELGAVWMGALRTVETSSGNINTIADNTVYEMAGIQYRINEVGGNYYATVIGYEEGMTECVVSEYVDEIDVPVTAIAENCFADIVSPFALVLPGSIKIIGLGAFKDSVGITSVRFNGTVGDWCGIDFGDETSNPMQFADGFFIGGTLLTEAVVPSAVTAINKYAFVGCDSLTDVVLPASLLTVGEKAFAACRNVAYVNYTGDIASWLTITFADEYANPVYYARDLHIGGATLTSVVIPKEVVSVKDYVLSRCDSLETVSYEPNSHLTSIGRHAFSYSNGLLTVSLPASLLNIDEYAFYYCNSLTSADFAVNSALESIGAYAFSDCGALTDAVLPDGLMRISSYAFTDCVSLSNVYVPDSLVTIGSFVFDNCPIQTAVVPGPVASAIKNTALQSLTITTGTSIESNAFAGCGYLTTVVLAETITAVGADAFFGCPIESATLPADVCGCVKNSELRTLVIIGEGSIADNAFTGCANLESVAIGEGVTEIGSGAFSGCSALTLIEYGGTIAQWGNVIKGTDWDASAGAYVVRCTNGEI